MPTCPKCGKTFNPSKADAGLRAGIGLVARAMPGMRETWETAKDYCNECFKGEFRKTGQIMLGTLDQAEGKDGVQEKDDTPKS